MNNNILNNRHDIYLLFEVTNGNPNGDPDAGNMPRLEPNSNRGIVSDVCLKRKVRNYVSEFKPERNGNGFEIFIKSGDALEKTITKAEAENNNNAEETVKWLCREFYDIRAFGGVLSTGSGVMKGSSHGQVRGPVQFTFSQSFHPINPLDITITRLVATATKDEEKERTMGNKYIVPYGLYSAKIYVSPAFAERTGFTDADLELLFEALNYMFEHDRSAARGEMIIRGIYDFEHLGTQHENNAEANRREARLGCAHAHKLFEGIKVDLKKDENGEYKKEVPESFEDYEVICKWDEEDLPRGVKLNKRHE
jgi:CRISPR-associated protein Csd2